MRVRLIALILVLGLQAAAQNTSASNVFDTQTAIAAHSPRVVAFTPAKEVKPRVFDRKFIVLAGIATAATMLDIATTSHCMSAYADCQEGNPLLGSHPSTGHIGMRFISLSLLTTSEIQDWLSGKLEESLPDFVAREFQN
jgi:hypothetical protein